MKRTTLQQVVAAIVLLTLVFTRAASAQGPLQLWYNQPAAQWVEALPVGNGHIGAMVFGGVEEELIQLNESTLYTGGPVKKNINPGAAAFLPLIRQALLKEENYTKANALAQKMQGLFTESYLPLGDIVIKQDFHGAAPVNYYRNLDLQQAIATTKYTINGVTYKREVFTSAPDNVMVVHITAGNKKGGLTFDVAAKTPLRYTLSVNGSNELVVSGKAPAHADPSYYNPKGREHIVYADTTGCYGMRYQYRIKAIAKDGKVTTDTTGIHVQQATEVVLFVAAATSFNGFDKCPDSEGKDEKALAAAIMNAAIKKEYASLRKAHINDFKKYFNRVSFTIQDTAATKRISMPVNERLKAYTKGAYDPALETLYFQFGRYLLISSSRPGGPPANLQGIWNKELRPPWSCNYTININTQMNYWPAEVTNLSDMHLPLLNWIKDLSVTGARTAREFYNAHGWVAHHNAEIWGTSNAVGDKGNGDPVWANWYMGGNWLCQHLWEHYAFTGDKKFLASKAYPVMKEAALFTLDWLLEDKDGYLITAPSSSPENKFKDKNGAEQGISVATTMDMAIIWDLFTNLIEAAAVLGIDADFRNTLVEKRKKLYPMHVGSKGQLQEWYKDFDESDPQHRHVSHLFGLYPGRQLSVAATPAFINAAERTLEIRGDAGTGWSRGWKINFWARLLNGDHAYKLIRQLLEYTNTTDGLQGGTYPNLFDACPPFQIDGNFGGTAGMAEMLVQSHLGEIYLLPALPAAWKTGAVKGLKARGAFEVSIQWNAHRLANAAVTSLNGGRCVIRTTMPVVVKGQSARSVKDAYGYLLTFNTQKGQVYELTPVSM